jgi:hypothetical protein
MRSNIAAISAALRAVIQKTFFAFSEWPIRRKLIMETSAPATMLKKKPILPATSGRKGGLAVSCGSGGPKLTESLAGSTVSKATLLS